MNAVCSIYARQDKASPRRIQRMIGVPTLYARAWPLRRMPMDWQKRPRVLVVNYHADTNRVMQRLLERWGMRVAIATSAAEAVVELERGQVDAMVTRLGLPDRP